MVMSIGIILICTTKFIIQLTNRRTIMNKQRLDELSELAKALVIPPDQTAAQQKVEGEDEIYLFRDKTYWGVFTTKPAPGIRTFMEVMVKGKTRRLPILALHFTPKKAKALPLKKMNSKDLFFKSK
jgi:hypothetical protein